LLLNVLNANGQFIRHYFTLGVPWGIPGPARIF
jgi:hypothetical protein